MAQRLHARSSTRLAVEELESRLTPTGITWHGSETYLLGMNYPWNQYGADFGNGPWGHLADANVVRSDFQQMAANGVQVARWWVFGDGRYAPLFNAAGKVTGLDGQFFADLDAGLQAAAANHILLDLTLTDFGMMDPAQNVGGVQLGGHASLFTDPTVRQSYLDNAVKPLLQRVAAGPYRDSVITYDIINEPEWRVAGGGFFGDPVVQYSAMKQFIQLNASYIHTYGGGALATMGSAKPEWAASWKGLGLDFYAVHYYPDFDTAGPGSGLPAAASLGLDRPVILEEFSTAAVSFGLHDTAPLSAEWYLDNVPALGYAGALGWAVKADNGTLSNWAAFAPVLRNWAAAHAGFIGQPDQPFAGPDAPPPSPVTPPPTTPIPTSAPPKSANPIVAVGTDTGAAQVRVYDARTQALKSEFTAFPGFGGGTRVAVGDVNGDGTPDIICAAGPGGGPEVRVFDGRTFQVIRDFMALPVQFNGGVFVAAGDVNGDGFADIITSADAGGGPQVTIWSGRDGQQLASFYATAATFTGGIRVAAGDVNGDGFADVIAVAGPGGGPQVTIFDGKGLRLLTAYYALTPTFTGGLYVAAGDVNGDGVMDVIAGADKGGGPQVTVFDGRTRAELASFYALPATFTGGVRVGYSSGYGGRRSGILTAAGPGGGPQTTVFNGDTLTMMGSFFATAPQFTGGVFVGGA